MIKICLDAGHAGGTYNQSPALKTYFEGAMNWKLHLLLKDELTARGFAVVTTRASREADLAVYSRGTAAKGCDVFLSLHSNACCTESVDYPVVYRAYDNKNDADELGKTLAVKIGEIMETRQAGRTAVRKNDAGNEYYGVLRGARAAGVPRYYIAEHSFHTNLAAATWLSADANLAQLAKAEADVFAAYFGVAAQTTGTAVMGEAKATAAQMAMYCRSRNAAPKLSGCSLDELARMYLDEGRAEGVRGDIAFAQALKETGFFQFGGIVTPDMNNYAGIGALNGNATGNAASFPNPRTGVRAQIQHLKAYASTAPLSSAQADPRFGLVARGCAPYVEWLGASDNPQGKGWAVPGRGYGADILKLLENILAEPIPEASSGEADTPSVPDWQSSGLAVLVAAHVIEDPAYWRDRFSETVTIGEIFGILGKLVKNDQ